jgi:hypothetical protein
MGVTNLSTAVVVEVGSDTEKDSTQLDFLGASTPLATVTGLDDFRTHGVLLKSPFAVRFRDGGGRGFYGAPEDRSV